MKGCGAEIGCLAILVIVVLFIVAGGGVKIESPEHYYERMAAKDQAEEQSRRDRELAVRRERQRKGELPHTSEVVLNGSRLEHRVSSSNKPESPTALERGAQLAYDLYADCRAEKPSLAQMQVGFRAYILAMSNDPTDQRFHMEVRGAYFDGIRPDGSAVEDELSVPVVDGLYSVSREVSLDRVNLKASDSAIPVFVPAPSEPLIIGTTWQATSIFDSSLNAQYKVIRLARLAGHDCAVIRVICGKEDRQFNIDQTQMEYLRPLRCTIWLDMTDLMPVRVELLSEGKGVDRVRYSAKMLIKRVE